MKQSGVILLAAGGTGGHLFPAEALAEQLVQRGFEVALVTDQRVENWVENFPGDIHQITSGTVTGSRLLGKVKGAFALLIGLVQALSLIGKIRPRAILGFGGYPSVPPILAGVLKGVPTLIHEQNAVMGRANRFLAPRVRAILTGFEHAPSQFSQKMTCLGNPVRRPVLLAARESYAPPSIDAPFQLLVFGGSQGAKVLSDVLPAALNRLPEALRQRLHITQQARLDDTQRVINFYEKIGVKAEIAPFFKDLPQKIAGAHLVIGRAGASTISELAVIGRPAILVPLPGALDQDQARNAAILSEAGAALSVKQEAFTPINLAEILERLMQAPDRLKTMAASARKLGMPDATSRIATHLVTMLAQNEQSV
jgi:UDP-N-acetylglucosamine--N-acetylmuramyl-(pentapeptide) pyrophosphoryl-undecaprenol N-acetylglucosamine transferase